MRVSTLALRGGIDLARAFDRQAAVLALSVGVDMTRFAPENLRDTSFILLGARTRVVPVLRPELRYELALSALQLTAAVYADASLTAVHYDVNDVQGTRRIAAPWRIRPGFMLTVGWQPTLTERK